ncbi:MAG: DOPA 4,5-dioxygenase family protein [Caulobacteraceae bacterium]|nr:DOPA 4,5-dioxygenase family protein [Caulobacteraceae bacterium]
MAVEAPDAPWHAHIYYDDTQRSAAEALRARLQAEPAVLYVGLLREGKVGPHPISQFEIHFRSAVLPVVRPLLENSGLRVLVHPLTDDDLADHTTLGQWIGEPLDLDLSVLDPPGVNQGLDRFGRTDF